MSRVHACIHILVLSPIVVSHFRLRRRLSHSLSGLCVCMCLGMGSAGGLHLRLMLPNLELKKCDTKTYSKRIPYVAQRVRTHTHTSAHQTRAHGTNNLNFNFSVWRKSFDDNFFCTVRAPHTIDKSFNQCKYWRTHTLLSRMAYILQHMKWLKCWHWWIEFVAMAARRQILFYQFITPEKNSNQMAKQIIEFLSVGNARGRNEKNDTNKFPVTDVNMTRGDTYGIHLNKILNFWYSLWSQTMTMPGCIDRVCVCVCVCVCTSGDEMSETTYRIYRSKCIKSTENWMENTNH